MGFRDAVKEIVVTLLGEHGYREVHARAVVRRLRTVERRPDPVLRRLIDRYLAEGACGIDIGAHTGIWTYLMAKRVGPNGIVYAFDASPHYAAVLSRALALLKVENVQVHSSALSAEDGWNDLITRDGAGQPLTGRTHLRGAHERATRDTIPVRTVRLDTLVQNDPRLATAGLIKCDVEGAELQVFEGARDFFERVRPVLFCEVQEEHCRRYGHSARAVFELLAHLGYASEQITPVDYLFVPAPVQA